MSAEGYRPNLVQMLGGSDFGSFATSEIGDAAVMHLIREIGRVYWNCNQQQWASEWGGEDPRVPGISWGGFVYLDDDSVRGALPSLVVAGHEWIGLRWYKYPGREMSTEREVSPDQWSAWLNEGVRLCREYENANSRLGDDVAEGR